MEVERGGGTGEEKGKEERKITMMDKMNEQHMYSSTPFTLVLKRKERSELP